MGVFATDSRQRVTNTSQTQGIFRRRTPGVTHIAAKQDVCPIRSGTQLHRKPVRWVPPPRHGGYHCKLGDGHDKWPRGHQATHGHRRETHDRSRNHEWESRCHPPRRMRKPRNPQRAIKSLLRTGRRSWIRNRSRSKNRSRSPLHWQRRGGEQTWSRPSTTVGRTALDTGMPVTNPPNRRPDTST